MRSQFTAMKNYIQHESTFWFKIQNQIHINLSFDSGLVQKKSYHKWITMTS